MTSRLAPLAMVLLLAGTGCAGSNRLAEPPASLQEVNEALDMVP